MQQGIIVGAKGFKNSTTKQSLCQKLHWLEKLYYQTKSISKSPKIPEILKEVEKRALKDKSPHEEIEGSMRMMKDQEVPLCSH